MHKILFKFSALISLLCALTACSYIVLNENASHVELAADPLHLINCQYLGDATGSAGHWYTYLFIENRVLVQAAADDLRNHAAEMGGDTVYIKENTPFNTSVTLLGLVYRCKKPK